MQETTTGRIPFGLASISTLILGLQDAQVNDKIGIDSTFKYLYLKHFVEAASRIARTAAVRLIRREGVWQTTRQH
jgi:hypothetical protein